jgi:hypothetical protein
MMVMLLKHPHLVTADVLIALRATAVATDVAEEAAAAVAERAPGLVGLSWLVKVEEGVRGWRGLLLVTIVVLVVALAGVDGVTTRTHLVLARIDSCLDLLLGWHLSL